MVIKSIELMGQQQEQLMLCLCLVDHIVANVATNSLLSTCQLFHIKNPTTTFFVRVPSYSTWIYYIYTQDNKLVQDTLWIPKEVAIALESMLEAKISSNKKPDIRLIPNRKPIHISTPHEHLNSSEYFLILSF